MVRTKNKLYKKSIRQLKGREREFYKILLYILNDEELALGYCGTFEDIAQKYNEINNENEKQ